ncbi:MAG: D-2-hydroxyacid dehydrogenase [Terriglobales bacterium]
MAKISVLAVCPPELPARAMLALQPAMKLTVAHERHAVMRAAPEAEVILYSALAGTTPPFASIWDHRGPGLRWVHSFEAGLDRLLLPELVASDVIVTNARGVYAAPLAEFAIFGILHFYQQGRLLLRQQQQKIWAQHEVEVLKGKVLAVVGYGSVGRACAKLGRRMGMRIHALRRHPERSKGERGIERTFAPGGLKEMLAGADVVLAAAPLTPETHHLLNAAAFALMKPSALVVNVGRGPVVDEPALVHALRERKLAGAVLDVYEREPLGPEHPFWTMDNVLLSPHCADRSRDPHWTELGMRCFLQNFRRYRSGQPLLTQVDKRAGY